MAVFLFALQDKSALMTRSVVKNTVLGSKFHTNPDQKDCEQLPKTVPQRTVLVETAIVPQNCIFIKVPQSNMIINDIYSRRYTWTSPFVCIKVIFRAINRKPKVHDQISRVKHLNTPDDYSKQFLFHKQINVCITYCVAANLFFLIYQIYSFVFSIILNWFNYAINWFIMPL